MSGFNPHYWQLIFWYYRAAPVVVSMSSQTGCPCRSCLCQEKGRRGKRKMMKMRLGRQTMIVRWNAQRLWKSTRVFVCLILNLLRFRTSTKRVSITKRMMVTSQEMRKAPKCCWSVHMFGHLMIGHWWCSQPLYFIILYPILPVTVRSRQNWMDVINWHLLNFSSHHTIFGSSSSPFAPEDDGPQESNAWKESLPFCHIVVYQDCTLPLLRKKSCLSCFYWLWDKQTSMHSSCWHWAKLNSHLTCPAISAALYQNPLPVHVH